MLFLPRHSKTPKKMLKKQITLDTLVRGLMGCLVGAGLLYLLYILRGALTPFFVAWLIAYLLFPLVKFLQYRCRLKYRAVAIVATFLIVAGVLWGGFLLIVPPMVEETIKEVFPKLPIVPYVMTGGTDARFYQEICDACIRFSPVVYGPAQMKGMHGLNERLDTYSLPGAVDYYKTLIKKNV